MVKGALDRLVFVENRYDDRDFGRHDIFQQVFVIGDICVGIDMSRMRLTVLGGSGRLF